jgi:hypothetical protein
VVIVVAVAVLTGLVLGGTGLLLLRRRRRFAAGRQILAATVTAVTDEALVLRLPAGESVTVPVAAELAARWRRQLAHGPGPFEEPDLQDPAGWDEVPVSYAPDASPPVVLSQALDDARTLPLVLVTLGGLTVGAALLALSIPILLAVLGTATGAVALLLGAGLLRTRRGPGSVALAVTVFLFLAATAAAMFVAAIRP